MPRERAIDLAPYLVQKIIPGGREGQKGVRATRACVCVRCVYASSVSSLRGRTEAELNYRRLVAVFQRVGQRTSPKDRERAFFRGIRGFSLRIGSREAE